MINSKNLIKQILANKKTNTEMYIRNKEMLHYKSIVHTQKHIYDSFSVERKISVRTVIENHMLHRMQKNIFFFIPSER